MDLDLVFLGTSGSAPTARRAPTALLVRRGGERLLFDCAEGTQRQLMRSAVGLPDLDEIFITHLHADHYLGLPGMLKTFALRQRDTPLTVYGPTGSAISTARSAASSASSPTRCTSKSCAPDRAAARRVPDPGLPGRPRRSAVGYALVEDERPGRFDVEKAEALGIPPGPERGALQRGETVTLADGRVSPPDTVVGAPRPGRRIVIPGDTAPTETVRVLAGGADVLVHEATFTDEDADRAAETKHSTARQAAEVAEAAHVRLLALTHVSPRYLGSELLREAREIFPDTVLPRDFDTIEVPFAERGAPHLVKGGALPDAAVREPLYPASAQPL